MVIAIVFIKLQHVLVINNNQLVNTNFANTNKPLKLHNR